MRSSVQKIRFCTSRDNVRIAYATCGEGPPLVRSLHWGTHLELEWQDLVWGPWLGALSRSHTLIRFDARGCGLSDREVDDVSSARHIDDLEAVVSACGLKRFALMGMTGGGPSSVAYAARHPEQVSHLVLFGSFLRGRIARNSSSQMQEETDVLFRLIRLGWERSDPAFRQLFSSQLIPEATVDQFRAFNELLRKSASAEMAERILRVLHADDVSTLASQVQCPTLVLHARDDARVPFEQGRALAAAIPNARFVPLDSRNHLTLEQEPAWRKLLAELEAFLPVDLDGPMPSTRDATQGLTRREREILELIAQGIDNRRIALKLYLGDKTIRNNVSNIMAKLGVSTRSEAIVVARDSGFGRQSSA
jgi:pimeloyl-ACP methyl ester carboxylesterase/DNA-binding CsgD family transcriptional regulator